MIDSYYLFKNLPSIDLHGMNRYEAKVKIDYFILQNKTLNNHLIAIVHGKRSGVLKTCVQNILKENKNVKAFKINIYNDGETIVEI